MEKISEQRFDQRRYAYACMLSRVRLCDPVDCSPHQAPLSTGSLGKNTGVDWRFLQANKQDRMLKIIGY